MNSQTIDNPKPKKEEEVIILDYLKFGYVNPDRPTTRGMPIAQTIGVDKFTLIERDKVNRVKGLLDFEKLTATSRIELEYAIKDIIKGKEDEYVKFFNEIDPLSIKLHKLELIPGIGKKHMNMILEEREKEPFKSFDDLKTRVPLLGDPVELLAKRVVLELDTTQVKRGKKKYYLFTQVPSRHPSNRRKRQNNKNRNRNNKNRGNKGRRNPKKEN